MSAIQSLAFICEVTLTVLLVYFFDDIIKRKDFITLH